MPAIWPIGIVDFHFRPQNLCQVVLRRRVECNGGAEAAPASLSIRHRYTKGALDVEVTPTLAESSRRGEDEVVCGVLGASVGNREAQHCGYNVVTVLFVGGPQTVFDQEGLVG